MGGCARTVGGLIELESAGGLYSDRWNCESMDVSDISRLDLLPEVMLGNEIWERTIITTNRALPGRVAAA